MKSYAILTSLLLVGVWASACQDSEFKRNDNGLNVSKGEGDQLSQDSESPETKSPLPLPLPLPTSETVDPPSNVSGTLLTCALELVPDTVRQDSLLGCRLSDANGRKVAVASDIQYSFKAIDATNIKMRRVLNDNRYDVLYLIPGSRSQAEEMTVALSQDNNPLVEKKVADVLVASNKLPEPRLVDYGKARSAILGSATASPLVVEALPADPIALGKSLYAQLCQSCHGVAGQDATKNIRVTNRDSIVGSLSSIPDMKDLDSIVTLEDAEAIARWLENPAL